MTVLREHARNALLAIYNVDLHDWTVSDDGQARPAMVVVEIQAEIMRAQERGGECAHRLTMLSQGDRWQDDESAILSYATEIGQLATRIRTLTSLRDLGIAPYLPRKDES